MKKEATEYSRLIRMFATPPTFPASEREMKTLKEADTFTVRCDDRDLPCYGFGEGKTILLCHGWGSRAGHLLLLAGALARAGFRAVAFDAPAHHSLAVAEKKQGHHVSNLAPSPIRRGGAGVRSNPSLKIQIPDHKHQIQNSNDPSEVRKNKETSNMFEFGRAISLVTRSLGEVYGVFGHSLGAMASLFAMAAFPHMEEYAFSCRKLVLVSTPANLRLATNSICRMHSFDESECRALEKEMQTTFAMAIDDYDCARALQAVPADKLIIQDANDEHFAMEETLAGTANPGSARILVTEGCGHSRILASKPVFAEIIDFLES